MKKRGINNIIADVTIPRDATTIDGAIGFIKHDLTTALIKRAEDDELFEFEQKEIDSFSTNFRMGGLYLSYSDYVILNNKLHDILINTKDEMQKTRVMELGALLSYRE